MFKLNVSVMQDGLATKRFWAAQVLLTYQSAKGEFREYSTEVVGEAGGTRMEVYQKAMDLVKQELEA